MYKHMAKVVTHILQGSILS